MSDFLGPHGQHHARLPCPRLSPRFCSDSRLLSWWCHPTISSSVIPCSACSQSFTASQSLPVSQFFPSGGQSIGASASASVFPKNIQGWLPLGLTSLILLSKRLSRFLYATTIDIWGQIILCGGGCPVQCRMCSSIPTLHPWEARRIPFFPSYKSQNCFQSLLNAPWWRRLFLLEGRVEIWTSLVVQWLRICLPVGGTWVQSMVWEDYTS